MEKFHFLDTRYTDQSEISYLNSQCIRIVILGHEEAAALLSWSRGPSGLYVGNS